MEGETGVEPAPSSRFNAEVFEDPIQPALEVSISGIWRIRELQKATHPGLSSLFSLS
jgi:hypothetical protein